MRILIYGINFFPEMIGTGKYTSEMAEWLASVGEDVCVVTSHPYYPSWKIFDGYSGWRYSSECNFDVKVYRCPIYVPSTPSSASRLLHLFSFSVSSLPVLFSRTKWRPDVVIVIAPTLLSAPAALCFAKISGAMSVLHIQDFEVDALFGLRMTRLGGLRRVALWLERKLLRGFDQVSTISTGMIGRSLEKGVPDTKLKLLSNWAEIDRFSGVVKSERYLRSLGVAEGRRVVLYAGNLGEKQGLEIVLDCASQFTNIQDVVFLIVGEGPAKRRLLESCRMRDIRNVIFSPLQAHDQLPMLLVSVDCHLVIQKRGVADAVMPSKLTNILAAGGNAVITADADTSLGRLCLDFPGIATLVEPESADALAAGVARAISLPKPNKSALNYAKEHLSKDRILSRYFEDLAMSIQRKNTV